MRSISILLLYLIVSSSIGLAQKHSGPIHWLTLQEADSLYQTNPKPLFIDVYTDWCGWCKRMDATTFQDKSIANYLNTNFYPVKLNAETNEPIRFQGKMYYNSQKEKVARMIDSLSTDLDQADRKVKSLDSLLYIQVTSQTQEIEINNQFISAIDSACQIEGSKNFRIKMWRFFYNLG